jgi:hypothetical protein
MNSDQTRENIKIRNLVNTYNMIVNLFWSVINLVPISIFCYIYLSLKLFLIFLITSFLSVFLPKAFFDSIQLGKTSSFYKSIGIKFINQFAQNGEIINKLVKRRYPNYKMVSGNRRSIRKLISQTYVFEKFHFMMFLFFMFVTVYAIIAHYWWWALVIFLTNVIYNVYPNFLQQYIRVRLKAYSRTF